MNPHSIGYPVTLVAGFLLCFLLLRSCSGPDVVTELPKPTRTIVTVHDTVWPEAKVVELPPRVIMGPVKEVSVLVYDTMACKTVKLYQDSLSDANLTIFSKDSVLGKLLGQNLSYRLKIPKEIHTTTTITDSIPYAVYMESKGIFLTGEAGGNRDMFQWSAGVDFITSDWGVGYRRDFVNKTHNVGVKWLIQWPPWRKKKAR